ncbi:hypothetical protein WJT86_04175 [Microvirga sp. W0021]|uniref:DUF304 domain-containing protein n=1 Tax=Hohaiivirga grylli TaxID=3133970 RepID=A0ABV0BH27_9HYPH
MFPKQYQPLKVGDTLIPVLMHKIMPLGILSAAICGMLVLAPMLVIVGLIDKPDVVLESMRGPNRHIWLYAGLAWCAGLVFNIFCGILLGKRRIHIEPDYLIVRTVMGHEKRISTREVTKVSTHFSLESMQASMNIRYQNGDQETISCAGIHSRDVSRLAEFLCPTVSLRIS